VPLAHLTGTAPVSLRDDQIDALRQFVTAGGVLLIDPCGGSIAFTESINKNLLPKLLPNSTAAPVPEGHALLAGLGKPRYRPYAIEARGASPGQLRTISAGAGQVILADLDLTSGLLGTSTWGIAGFQAEFSENLVRNLILWTISRLPTQ
jgi:hypothetical protein